MQLRLKLAVIRLMWLLGSALPHTVQYPNQVPF